MSIIGLDVGRNHAVAAALEELPSNIQRYYSQHRREFVRVNCDKEGFDLLWAMQPEKVVMEPTGGWYSRLTAERCEERGIEVLWVGHADLKAQRQSYGFKNKRDPEDALCLAACYFDNRFIDKHGQKRFIQFNQDIRLLQDWFYESEQLDKVGNGLVNQIRQRLCYEFPEWAQHGAGDSSINDKLGCHPFWAALAGSHSYHQFKKAYSTTVGAGLSDYTKLHAAQLVELQRRTQPLLEKMEEFLSKPEFEPYLKAMAPFKFGLKNKAYLVCKLYPFDKFLVDGRPWIEHHSNSKGKRSKHDHSQRQLQAYLGLSYTMEKSGDSGQLNKKFHGSKVCRSSLYMWAKNKFDRERGKHMDSEQGQALWQKHRSQRRLQDNGNGQFKAGEDAIGGDDAIIRLLFRTTYELYKNLKQEFL
ncbi:MAG: transposase [Microcoleaceae cyanobacterium]